MSNRYVIKWVSKVNGRAGKGSKVFRRPEAEALVEELNREYPDIHHEVIVAPPEGQPEPEPVDAETAESMAESEEVEGPSSKGLQALPYR